jgi:hypothetical protein
MDTRGRPRGLQNKRYIRNDSFVLSWGTDVHGCGVEVRDGRQPGPSSLISVTIHILPLNIGTAPDPRDRCLNTVNGTLHD